MTMPIYGVIFSERPTSTENELIPRQQIAFDDFDVDAIVEAESNRNGCRLSITQDPQPRPTRGRRLEIIDRPRRAY